MRQKKLFAFLLQLTPNFIHVGGLTTVEANPLESEWQEIVDKAPKGIVIFSMGSVANTSRMPMAWKEAIVYAMGDLPDYTFIIRLQGEIPKNKPKNVIVSEWLPQKDLLGKLLHQRVFESVSFSLA